MAPGPDYIEVADVRGLRSQLADLRGHERDKEDEEGERTTWEYAEFIRHAHNIFLQPLSSKESAQLKTFEDKDSLWLPDETSDKDRWLTHVGKRNHDTDQSMLPRNDTIIDSEFLLQVGRYQLLSQRGSLAVRDHLNHENTLTVLHSTHDESDDTGFTPISAQIDTDGMLLLHVEDAEIIDKKRRVREYHFSVNFDSDTGQLTKTTS